MAPAGHHEPRCSQVPMKTAPRLTSLAALSVHMPLQVIMSHSNEFQVP